MSEKKIRVTVWNEFRHEKEMDKVKAIYPEGMHKAIGEMLRNQGDFEITYATLDDPDHGLSQEVLDRTDVLFWWGHAHHGDVRDEIVDRIQKRVLAGMGLIVLHSGHKSKIFMRMLGTTANLQWREANEKERIWVIEHAHPIAQGLPDHFELPHTEMYGERFDIPKPDDIVFITWYEGGEVFRSGVTFTRGYGKIFYFAPGHETFPIYFDSNIQKVLVNAAKWAAPLINRETGCPMVAPLEEIKSGK